MFLVGIKVWKNNAERGNIVNHFQGQGYTPGRVSWGHQDLNSSFCCLTGPQAQIQFFFSVKYFCLVGDKWVRKIYYFWNLFFFRHFTPSLKEEDKKILRLMTQRREAAIREEEIAHSIRNMWAEEKKQHLKVWQHNGCRFCWSYPVIGQNLKQNLGCKNILLKMCINIFRA